MEEDANQGITKKLFDPASSTERIKVYLRIRPFSAAELKNNEDQGTLQVEDDTSVCMMPPRESMTAKSLMHDTNNQHQFKFAFTHVYRPEVSQKEFFTATTLKSVNNVMNGLSSLFLSYGITSSGKTYTMQGTPEDPGIIPQTIDTLFFNIQDKLCPFPAIKPLNFSELVVLSEEEQEQEIHIRDGLLQKLTSSDLTRISSNSSETTAANPSLGSETEISVNSTFAHPPQSFCNTSDMDEGKYCIWVSFGEIYNQSMYDLLSTKKSAKLRLAKDKNGNSYIKGLTEVCVFSSQDALGLLTLGQKHLKIAETNMNRHSSRSHAVFTIRVIKFSEYTSLEKASITNLTFCDLAGSERTKKTKNTKDRLKETGYIHTSLLVLGRCIEALRHNQIHKEKVVVPFRDSKLTNVFQPYFVGRGYVSMIVNINCCASMFDETLKVMKFSAIARQVVTNVVSEYPKFMSNRVTDNWILSSDPLSKFISAQSSSAACEITEELDTSLHECSMDASMRVLIGEKMEQLVQLVRYLEAELVNEKKQRASLLKRNNEIREEYSQLLDQLKQSHSERLKEYQNLADKLREQKQKYFVAYMQEKFKKPEHALENESANESSSEDDDSEDEIEDDDDDMVDDEDSAKVREEVIQDNKHEQMDAEVQTDLEEVKEPQNLEAMLKNDQACYENEMKLLQESVSLLESKRDSLNKMVLQMQVAKADQEEKLKEKDDMICSLNNTISEMKQMSESMEKEKVALQNEVLCLKELEKKLEEERESKATIECELSLLREQKESQISELQMLSQKLEEDIAGLKAKIQELSTSLTEANAEKNKLELEKEELLSKMHDVQELQLSLENSKSECQKYKNQLEALESSFAKEKQLHTELKEKESEIEAVKNENSELLSKLQKMSELVSQIEAAQADVACSNKQLEEEKKLFIEDSMKKEKKISNLQKENEKLNKQLAELRMEVALPVEKCKSLESTITDLKDENRQLREKLKSTEQSYLDARQELSESRQANSEYEAQIKELQNKFCSLEKRLCKSDEACTRCSLARGVASDDSPKSVQVKEEKVSPSQQNDVAVEQTKKPEIRKSVRRKCTSNQSLKPAEKKVEPKCNETRSKRQTSRAKLSSISSAKSSLSEDEFETSAPKRVIRKRRKGADKENSLLNVEEKQENSFQCLQPVTSPMQNLTRFIRTTSPALKSAAQQVITKLFTPTKTLKSDQPEDPDLTATKPAKRKKFYHESNTTITCSPQEEASTSEKRWSSLRLRPRK